MIGRARGALSIAGLAAALLLFPGSATAIASSSQITTPSGLTYLLGEAGAKTTIAGTAEGLSEVDICCYTGTEGSPGGYETIEEEVPVEVGAFSIEVPTTFLPSKVCQLRAVPSGSKKSLPPGTKTAFEGPIVLASQFTSEPRNFSAASSTLVGSFFLQSAGLYPLESSLYSAAAHEDVTFFFGDANLTAAPPIGTRAAVQVDGADAYLPWGAKEVESNVKKALTGAPSVTVTKSFDPLTHQITLLDEEQLVKCSPAAAEYPATEAGCKELVSTGVTLQREWRTSNEDHVAWLNETWKSTDGKAHTVNARYLTEMASGSEDGVYQFPGEGAFAATKKGELKALPSGPGVILYKSNASVSEAGDGKNPQGAIVYDSAPTEPLSVTTGSTGEPFNTANNFEVPYQRSVPAGGSSSMLRMAFVQAFALTEVRPLAEGALAGFTPTPALEAKPQSGGGSTGGGGGSSAGGTTATISPAQLQSALVRLTTPQGKAARIAALLKAGGFSVAFKALEPGSAAIGWYYLPQGATLAKKAKPKAVLIAFGRTVFPAAETATLKLRLTPAGRTLLKHARTIRLTAKVAFTPVNGATVTVVKKFALKR